ncbi:MAG: DUF6465 family protein [Clostridiales bacterium]|nr:DUF6465 family protein [Clostridiales bacterium]
MAGKAATKKETIVTEKTPEKKTAARAPRKSKTQMTTEIFVQFWGKEANTADIVDSIKKVWKDEMGRKIGDMKDLKIYIKPEDNGAHYVINGEITGFIGL